MKAGLCIFWWSTGNVECVFWLWNRVFEHQPFLECLNINPFCGRPWEGSAAGCFSQWCVKPPTCHLNLWFECMQMMAGSWLIMNLGSGSEAASHSVLEMLRNNLCSELLQCPQGSLWQYTEAKQPHTHTHTLVHTVPNSSLLTACPTYARPRLHQQTINQAK